MENLKYILYIYVKIVTLISPPDKETQITFKEIVEKSSYTILYFYPKDNTPGCTKEARDFSSLLADFAKLSIQVVGVSKDAPSSHCNFIEKQDLQVGLIADQDLTLHHQFNTRGEKKNYGKTYEGVIRSTFLLDQNGTIIKERRNVKATGHAQRILNYVQKEFSK